jgi:hypothetical protein
MSENANNIVENDKPPSGDGKPSPAKVYQELESQLNRILSELNESFLKVPLEEYDELYGDICTKVADFLEADVCSLFLKSSDTSLIPPRQKIYMVASNRGSPWHNALQIPKKIEYSWNEQGTTTYIWRQGYSRICNDLAQISAMRGGGKFPGNAGKYDHFVWLGENPWGCFRNFIGIPVRIIPPVTLDSDDNSLDPPIPIDIGVLKAENKTIPSNKPVEGIEKAIQEILSKDYKGNPTESKENGPSCL